MKSTSVCSRSASEGDLAEAEEPILTPAAASSGSGFFTLPRLMSGRRRSRRRKRSTAGIQGGSQQPPPPPPPRGVSPPYSEGFFVKVMRQLAALAFPTPRARSRQHPVVSASSTDVRPPPADPPPRTANGSGNGTTPGVCGIRNHGNTCFMNAVVQCLSHSDPFAEYFVMDHYQVDLLRRRRGKRGSRGEVTGQLAALLKALWAGRCPAEASLRFKELVARHGPRYRDGDQHDAQEFLLWLLDQVHEDLNAATKRKYKKPKSSHGRPDEVVAAEALANHLRCNSSFVHDLFQAQFRSSLTCHRCKKQSNTFDPYLCLSLPIPDRQADPLVCTLVRCSGLPRQVRFGVMVSTEDPIRTLRAKISLKFTIPESQLLLIELSKDGFHRTFRDEDPISVVRNSPDALIVETPPLKPVDEAVGEHLLLVWINRVGTCNRSKMFGSVFVRQVPREATFMELQKEMLHAMKDIMQDDINHVKLGIILRLRVVGGLSGRCYLPSDVDHPLYMPTVDKALTLCDEEFQSGPLHLKLIAEWDLETKEDMIKDVKELEEEDPSVKEVENRQQDMSKATLQECFELCFTEEQLEPEDAWSCPSCHRRQPGLKKLSLWSCPDIFIIHLKRFRQSGNLRTKLTTPVDFPIAGLDAGAFTPHRNHDFHNHLTNGGMGMFAWSPWKRPRMRHLSRGMEDNVYDLFAVCNHQGNLHGGHYTAMCKNPVDGQWYHLDDTKVKTVQELDIVTPDAYILFYQRSGLSSASCASSSTSGYSSSSMASLLNSEHWSFRMPPFYYLPSKCSKSQDNLYDIDTPASATQDRKVFSRGQRAYSSLGPTSSRSTDGETEISEFERHSDEDISGEDTPPPPPPPPPSVPPPPPPPASGAPKGSYWTITSV